MFHFQNSLFLLLIPFVLAMGYFLRNKKVKSAVTFSTEKLLYQVSPSLKAVLAGNLHWLRILTLCLISAALARPVSPLEQTKIHTEGINIMLAMDVSTSMLAEDFTLKGKRVNRLEAVKDVVKKFIQGRKNDRIGLTAFAARPYMVSPLTLDYSWLLQNLERIKAGMIEDGTAIGLGLASSLNRLKDTKAKSKIVILLTDGRNNMGDISPSLSAETARSLGIKVYTIGVGSRGLAPYPVRDFFGNKIYRSVKIDIDEDILTDIASKTNGKYFRATDTKSLRKIYKEIDEMEKTPVEEKGYLEYKELFTVFLAAALALVLLEEVLSNTILRRLP
ncbi:MAG: VWA domain-containing protein [Candidatus Aureabacteria bacterium]|nr:VWA domain-containing protein [Candidatus Auribacterota bacterium]